MNNRLEIKEPSGTVGFVEYKRSFDVQGLIELDDILDENALLEVFLYDQNQKLVRYVYCNQKKKPFLTYHKDFTCYKEELDPKRQKLLEFGFPELMVEDIKHSESSLHKASIKAFYNEHTFKAIIVSASNTSCGAVFEDGLDLRDDEGKVYSLLEMGEYMLEVKLTSKNISISTNKKIVIGKRKEQFICRFNPISHKNRMIQWAKEHDYSVIMDTLPGYLDSYLGTWYYHMGLLKMYRANDVALYDDVKVTMFDYLIDETSTSYATELGFLESRGMVEDERTFSCYHYRYGEAKILDYESSILKFKKNEILYLCRIDIVKENTEDVFYLDERYLLDTRVDFKDIVVRKGTKVQFMGVVKPIQMSPNDFILKQDNTYEVKNKPETILYTFNNKQKYLRKLNMERIDTVSIGKSVYEFYNGFQIEEESDIQIDLYDTKKNLLDSKRVYIGIQE